MNIPDNVVRHALRHVYFITGTACGGKTTLSRALADKHGWLRYDADERFNAHQAAANPTDQPSMTAVFPDQEAYFMRPPSVYRAWLDNSLREQLPFALADLAVLAADRTVVADLHIPLDQLAAITVPERVVCLVTTPERVANDYLERPDHRPIRDCLHSLPHPDRAIANVKETLRQQAQGYLQALEGTAWLTLWRDEHSTVTDTLARIEAHFGL